MIKWAETSLTAHQKLARKPLPLPLRPRRTSAVPYVSLPACNGCSALLTHENQVPIAAAPTGTCRLFSKIARRSTSPSLSFKDLSVRSPQPSCWACDTDGGLFSHSAWFHCPTCGHSAADIRHLSRLLQQLLDPPDHIVLDHFGRFSERFAVCCTQSCFRPTKLPPLALFVSHPLSRFNLLASAILRTPPGRLGMSMFV